MGGKPHTGFVRESSRIGANLVALVVSRFVCLGLSLVQAGIIFHTLSLAGRGQFSFALNYASLFTVFATLGIQRLLVRDISRDYTIAWSYVWTATALVACLSGAVYGAIAGSVFLLGESAAVQWAVLMAALSVVVLWALERPFEAVLMARERMVLVAVVNFVAGILKLLSVYVVMRYTATSAAAHAAIALGNLAGFVFFACAAFYVGGWEWPRIRFSLAVAQVRECFPYMVAMIFSLVYFKSDIAILKWLVERMSGAGAGEEAAGVYGPVLRVTEPILMIASIWGTAVFPALCRLSATASENYARLRKTSVRMALLTAFPMAVGLAFLAAPIMGLMTGDSSEQLVTSVLVLRMLCVVVPFFYLNGVGQEILYATHRNWFVVRCYGLAAAVSVLGNLIAIPLLGVPGVAVAAILANSAVSVLFIWGMQSECGEMGLVSLVCKTAVACLAMGFAAYGLERISLAAGVAVGAAVYVFLQTLLRTLTPMERDLVRRMVAAPLTRRAKKEQA